MIRLVLKTDCLFHILRVRSAIGTRNSPEAHSSLYANLSPSAYRKSPSSGYRGSPGRRKPWPENRDRQTVTSSWTERQRSEKLSPFFHRLSESQQGSSDSNAFAPKELVYRYQMPPNSSPELTAESKKAMQTSRKRIKNFNKKLVAH